MDKLYLSLVPKTKTSREKVIKGLISGMQEA